LGYHAEEYGPTLEDYTVSCVAMCNRCHAMIHARFETPNLWRAYVSQANKGWIDASLFPDRARYVSLLSKFRSRDDTAEVPVTPVEDGYLSRLPTTELAGPAKAATLRVQLPGSGEPVEVPDWLVYGSDLSFLSTPERITLESRGIDVQGFVRGEIPIERVNGRLVYRRLYFGSQKVRRAPRSR
jgi:hypothetical protein